MFFRPSLIPSTGAMLAVYIAIKQHIIVYIIGKRHFLLSYYYKHKKHFWQQPFAESCTTIIIIWFSILPRKRAFKFPSHPPPGFVAPSDHFVAPRDHFVAPRDHLFTENVSALSAKVKFCKPPKVVDVRAI